MVLSDEISISLSRVSALVSSCRLLGFRSGGLGHGNHDAIDDNVPDRILDAGRLSVDVFLPWSVFRRGRAVWGRAFNASPDSSVVSSNPMGVSTDRCFDAVGEAMSVIAVCCDDVEEAGTDHAGPEGFLWPWPEW